MLDQPLKQGREARYSYRHLLQMLLVRRLHRGLCCQCYQPAGKRRTGSTLQGGVHLTVTPANPALAFLQQIQQRQGAQSQTATPKSTPVSLPRSNPKPVTALARWTRLEVSPGLELHVREDFTYPSSPQEQQTAAVNQQLLAP